MPRASDVQLSLSVRQEGSGAMRVLLRAAYSLTHEPEKTSYAVHPVERASLPIYRRNDSLQSAISSRTFMHSATCLTITSSIAPFYTEKTMYHVYLLTRSGSVHCGSFHCSWIWDKSIPFSLALSQKKNDVVFRPCSCARTGRGCPVRLRSIVSLQHTLCLQADVFFSGTNDDVVKKLNADDASDLNEPFGHLDVFP